MPSKAKNNTQLFTNVNFATSANNNQTTLPTFMLETPKLFIVSTYATKTTFTRITTHARIPTFARITTNARIF